MVDPSPSTLVCFVSTTAQGTELVEGIRHPYRGQGAYLAQLSMPVLGSLDKPKYLHADSAEPRWVNGGRGPH